ncbi:unnamed protein product, partial [Ectocarpus sp. 8 AP-2014]
RGHFFVHRGKLLLCKSLPPYLSCFVWFRERHPLFTTRFHDEEHGVVLKPPSGMRYCLQVGDTQSKRAAEPAQVHKPNTETHFGSRLQAVCNQNWTIRSVSGTRAEGVYT